ncbi:MAG: Bifunctional protein: zinc-containing alcohol dehydrogenase quinone oxidoreductase [Jatrophihabitantaceae bacterium]|nr:Bifunctional protein: zinc-containing alcohol dehydrogenase quinone oxidoreductase [Jatrophihabitantaceae bacterium]
MSSTMRAVGYRRSLPASDPQSLIDLEVAVPDVGPRDLLVRVEAVSVNPVDTKVRRSGDPTGARILGFDAAGVVERVGADVGLFAPGDEVYYAGSIARPGTDAQWHAVHENLVGRKPSTLSFAEAAALPLTTITAWETLFEKFAVPRGGSGTLLVVGAAGGVGSMLIQLAAALTDLRLIGTASRPESREWARGLGAHEVVDHHGDLADAVRAVAPEGVDYIFSPYSVGNVGAYADLLRVGGHVAAIDEPAGLDTLPLKRKSGTWHWEGMFAKALNAPEDASQHALLDEVADLVDAGMLRSTLTTLLEPINAESLREAHARVESGSTIGKVVIAGWR